jgi:hypothetical protein
MAKLLLANGISLALSCAAFAQQNSTKEQIVGAWSLVSVISETGDGKRGGTVRNRSKRSDDLFK